MYVCVHAWADLAIEPFTVLHDHNLFLHGYKIGKHNSRSLQNRGAGEGEGEAPS